MTVDLHHSEPAASHFEYFVGQDTVTSTRTITPPRDDNAHAQQLLYLLNTNTHGNSWKVVYQVNTDTVTVVDCIPSGESTDSYSESFEFCIHPAGDYYPSMNEFCSQLHPLLIKLTGLTEAEFESTIHEQSDQSYLHSFRGKNNSHYLHKIILFQEQGRMVQLLYTCNEDTPLDVDLWTQIFNACEFAL